MSCVIDCHPKYHHQVVRLISSLLAADPERRVKKVVHYIAPLPTALARWLAEHEVMLQEVPSYGVGPAAYCNKLQQFELLLSLQATYLILCDADLFFLSSPELLIQPDKICARVVDRPNPEPEVLRSLLQAAGFCDEMMTAHPTFLQRSITHRMNCNGGLYVIGREQLKVLAPAWRSWAAFCLAREDILKHKLMHSDQLGFMLGMLETGMPLTPLPGHANFPTHLPADCYVQVPRHISSLHYHGNVLDDGRLGSTGVAAVDLWIDEANEIVRAGGSISSGAPRHQVGTRRIHAKC